MSSGGGRWGLVPRLCAAGACCALEWTLISGAFHPVIGGSVVAWFLVPFCAAFLALGYTRVRTSIPSLSDTLSTTPVGWSFVAAHVAALAMFLTLARIFDGGARGVPLTAALYASALLSIVFAALAVVPARAGALLLRRTGNVWMYAAVAGLIAWRLVFEAAAFWDARPQDALAGATFHSVRAVLSAVLPDVTAEPERLRIVTPRFKASIGGACSGIEGLGLMLVFSVTWLWYFRRESRFPEALVLIPVALTLTWLANVARIVVLVLIGHFGARSIAVGGFHSQAGWITFNVIAVGFVVAAGRLPWLSRTQEDGKAPAGDSPEAAYLTPFAAILAALLVSRLLSGGFEWLYPLRLAACGAALWYFRATYRSLNWRVGGIAVLAGALAFVLWIAADAFQGSAPDAFPSALAKASPSARVVWLALRAAAAIVTVPIAEELAFRGYLARRVTAPAFETVSLRALTPVGMLVSSLAFGLMHGGQWPVATAVGVLYAAVLRRSGSLGDAAAAHATTNALLAGWVLTRGAWHLW